MRILMGLEQPSEGRVRLRGQDVTHRAGRRSQHRLRAAVVRALSPPQCPRQHRLPVEAGGGEAAARASRSSGARRDAQDHRPAAEEAGSTLRRPEAAGGDRSRHRQADRPLRPRRPAGRARLQAARAARRRSQELQEQTRMHVPLHHVRRDRGDDPGRPRRRPRRWPDRRGRRTGAPLRRPAPPAARWPSSASPAPTSCPASSTRTEPDWSAARRSSPFPSVPEIGWCPAGRRRGRRAAGKRRA